MTRRIRPMSSALAVLASSAALALALGLTPPAAAQETDTSTGGTGDAAAPAAPAAPEKEENKSGYRRGRHRLEFMGGYHYGATVRDAGILASPITGQPGSREYPAKTPLNIELADSPVLSMRYAWFASENWGIELGLSALSSKIQDPDVDLAQDEADLANSTLTSDQQAILLDRLAAHTAKHDMDVTFVDFGAMHVFNPKKRWPIEIGGGLGWAFSSLDGPVAYERLVTSDVVPPNTTVTVANDVVDPPPPYGQCLADNDPCIELQEQGGLTWHAYMEVGYAFTPAVQLRFGVRTRFVEQLVDPGDSQVMNEFTLGIGWLFGGN